ncbi:hypothetical protein ACS0TY_006329 [Phlomoides rotata]
MVRRTKKKGKGTNIRRQQRTVTCKKCGTKGHNAKTCSIQRGDVDGSEPSNTTHDAHHTASQPSISAAGTRATANDNCTDGNTVSQPVIQSSRTRVTSKRKVSECGTNSETDESSQFSVAPPRLKETIQVPFYEMGIGTQESGVTTVKWYGRTTQPHVQGPTPHQ